MGYSHAEIQNCALFEQVEVPTLVGLLDRCLPLAAKAGEVIISPDDETRCFFLVLEGNLSVHIGSVDSDPVASVGVGESVGELRLIDERPPSAYVVARDNCRLLAIGPEAFFGLIQSSHEFTVNLLSLLARRLRGNNETVDQSRRLQAEYKRHASVDGLTGLFNRRRLDEVLPRYLARAERENEKISVLMVDVDYFKKFNDSFGHAAGDRVLYEVAKVLRDRCRPSDFVARFGGEEFTMVLPSAGASEAMVVAERLRTAVEKLRVQLDSGIMLPPITISLGIAENVVGVPVSELLEAADRALYAAKQSGRNQAQIASPKGAA
jgi:diguanylate cyclase (GGDEF)-like protein